MAKLFLQLINSRYGRASTVLTLTSNKGFEEWGEILHDEVMATALPDRLLHRCHIVNIRGNSSRMRDHRELPKTIHPTAASAVSAEQAQIEEGSWRSSDPQHPGPSYGRSAPSAGAGVPRACLEPLGECAILDAH